MNLRDIPEATKHRDEWMRLIAARRYAELCFAQTWTVSSDRYGIQINADVAGKLIQKQIDDVESKLRILGVTEFE